jgi:hypothetical protein
MKWGLFILVCCSVFAVTAHARMGETKVECMDRYGEGVTNLPGIGDLTGVDVYLKDDILVSLFFVKTGGQEARAGMVIYSRVWPGEEPDVRHKVRSDGAIMTAITTNEQVALLATIPGRWEEYAVPPPALAGKSTKVIPLTNLASPTEKNGDVTSRAIRKAYNGLHTLGLRSFVSYVPKNVAHNGPRLFAFRIGGDLVFCSCDAVPAITKWAEYVTEERTKVDRLRKNDLKGF